jgi:hypothetical protein
MHLITKQDNEDKIHLFDYLAFSHQALSDVIVHREWYTGNGSIDLLIDIPTLNITLLIENKFHSSESSGQLTRYITHVKDMFPNRNVLPVYLTLSSDLPSHEDYWVLDYGDVLTIIKQELELNRATIADNIYDFLTYYTSLLEERLVENEEADRTALQLYQENTLAIQLLFANANPSKQKQVDLRKATRILKTLDEDTKRHLRIIYNRKRQTIDHIIKVSGNILPQAFELFANELQLNVYSAHSRVPNFVMNEWLPKLEQLPRLKRYWLNYALIMWFERKGDKRLKLYVEVGPIPYERRLELLEAIEEKGISFMKSGKQEGKKFTRIYTDTMDVPDWTNANHVHQTMKDLVETDAFRDFHSSMIDVLKEVTENNHITPSLRRD